jgi:hypothetical protein
MRRAISSLSRDRQERPRAGIELDNDGDRCIKGAFGVLRQRERPDEYPDMSFDR